MTLELENIGKVRHAKLDLKGLTVIVGDNNSGKSTVGKVLASLFTVLPTIDERVVRARRDYVFDEDAVRFGYRFRRIDSNLFANLLDDTSLTEKDLRDRMFVSWRRWRPLRNRQGLDEKELSEETEILNDSSHSAFARLLECRKIPRSKLVDIEVGKAFARYFYGVVKTGGAERGVVRLSVQDSCSEIVWDDSAHCNLQATLANRGWFLGSPLIVNSISGDQERVSDPERMHEPLLQQLNSRQEANSVSRAIVGDKMRPIEERLEAVLGGRIFYSEEDGDLMISGKSYPRPLRVKSLSMGLKAFALLRWMLEKGVLREGDVLVLDEPENHLHPTWQILYAELIVMLQKCFDLTVLLTTHSPYFLEAIQLYAKKCGIAERLTAYQPKFDDSGFVTTIDEPIADDHELYRKFTAPLRELDILRSET